MEGLTEKQFNAMVERLKKLSNRQLAMLNFEVWKLARDRGAVRVEGEE